MAKLTIDLTGAGGLAPKHQGDVHKSASEHNLRYQGGENQMAEGIYNPIRRFGYLSPSTTSTVNVTAATGSFGDKMYSVEYLAGNEEESIWFGADDTVWKADSASDTTLGQEITSITDAGAGDSTRVLDLQLYQLNGSATLFYLWKGQTTNGHIGSYDLGSTTANDDWFAADASGYSTSAIDTGANIPSFMRTADNALMYVFENGAGARVHSVDGSSTGGAQGTVNEDVLVFPDDVDVRDAIDYRGRMFMILETENTIANPVNHVGDYGVYVWDRRSTIVSNSDYIPLPGVRTVIRMFVSAEGNLMMICVGANRMTQIRQFNGATFQILAEAGIDASPTISESVTIGPNGVFWVGRDGKVYMFGRPDNTQKQAGLFVLADLYSGVTNFETAAIIYAGTTSSGTLSGSRTDVESLYIAYEDDGTPKVNIFAPHASADSTFTQTVGQGNVYTLVKYLPVLSTVNNLDIYMAPTSSGSTEIADIKIYFNQSTTAWATKTVTLDDASKGYKQIPVNKPYVNSIQLEIEWKTSRTLGVDDFTPNICIVEYTPTTARKDA